MLKKLLLYILIGIAIPGAIILYVGLGRNIAFVIVGLVLILPFVLFLLISYLRAEKKKNDDKLTLETFKKTAEQIKVDLNLAEISTNSWTDEIVSNNKAAGWNQLSGDGGKNIKYIPRTQNWIRIKVPYKDTFIHYEVIVEKEITSLKMHFALQKETILYIDKNNPDINYLDLEFLQ